jgi:hypothetical protein
MLLERYLEELDKRIEKSKAHGLKNITFFDVFLGGRERLGGLYHEIPAIVNI